jgi:hypothetical protein
MHEYSPSFRLDFPHVEMVLVEWDNCNIVDETRDVPTCLLTLIEKLVFGCFSNLKEKILEKLVQGRLTKIIIVHDQPLKG